MLSHCHSFILFQQKARSDDLFCTHPPFQKGKNAHCPKITRVFLLLSNRKAELGDRTLCMTKGNHICIVQKYPTLSFFQYMVFRMMICVCSWCTKQGDIVALKRNGVEKGWQSECQEILMRWHVLVVC